MIPIFVTGTGTGVGKTLVAGIIAMALDADYWKPVQAGYDEQTDAEWVQSLFENDRQRIHGEVYKLKMAASPHIAARQENLEISPDRIKLEMEKILSSANSDYLVIEGAGGLMAPLNEKEFVIDLMETLGAPAIIVSRNYLGSINHSLLTAAALKQRNIPVLGWIFNDQYLDYTDEIVHWSGYPALASIPFYPHPGREMIVAAAKLLKPRLKCWI